MQATSRFFAGAGRVVGQGIAKLTKVHDYFVGNEGLPDVYEDDDSSGLGAADAIVIEGETHADHATGRKRTHLEGIGLETFKFLHEIIVSPKPEFDIPTTIKWVNDGARGMNTRAKYIAYTESENFWKDLKLALNNIVWLSMENRRASPKIVFPDKTTRIFTIDTGGTTIVLERRLRKVMVFFYYSPEAYTIDLTNIDAPYTNSDMSWYIYIDEDEKTVLISDYKSRVQYAKPSINVQSQPKNSSLAPRRVGDTTTFIVPWEELHKPSNPNAVRMEIVPWDRGDGRPVQKSADAFYTALEEVVRGLTTGIDDVSLSRTINGVRGNYPKYPETRDSVETIVAEMVYVARTFSKTKAIAETVAPVISANRAEIVNRVMQRL